ncbi:Hypothetical protein I5071_6380 [Sandaracinus amylolyticus]|nr:Hypothetical protein I5071_6380 [Sandaracinus amylolyticus]
MIVVIGSASLGAIVLGAGLGVLVEPWVPAWDAATPEVAAEPEGEFDARADLDDEARDAPRDIPNALVAAELEAERYVAVGNTPGRRETTTAGVVPVPEAPREEGLLGAITDARLGGEDRDAFYLAVDANRRAESGTGGARFSALRTTAGVDHRASFGVAQLTIRDHLFHLSRLTDAQLAELGIGRLEIGLMQRRGDAVGAWYEIIVERRAASDAASRAGLDAAQVRDAQALAASGDRRGLIARHGRRFASSSGLPADALAELADTLVLRRREVRDAFLRRYERDHGTGFDRASRDGARMTTTARAVARERPDVQRVLERFGGGDPGAISLGHYLGVGDVAENYYGWYARAATEAVGRTRYARVLEIVDPISSRLRELSNFEHALAAVIGVRDLAGIERARMLARIGRCFHGAPGRARDAFFFAGDPRRPRATSAAELEAGIQEYRLGRQWSDERVQRAFDELAAERGLLP